ncbi:MAG: hypothetical protein WC989_03685 [Micavibrio sp.]
MDHYREFAQNLIAAHPQSRTASGVLDGRTFWIKRPAAPKARIWHSLQKAIAALTRMPILRATVSRGGSASLRAEAARLKLFGEAGLRVPAIRGLYDDMMVMDDSGQSLNALLDSAAEDERKQFLFQAASALAAIHHAGFAHGRPYLRDMTWDGETVGFLDLEEDPAQVMPLSDAKARDVWIFLASASRYARVNGSKLCYDDRLILALMEDYARAGGEDTLGSLRHFTFFLRPVRKLLERPFWWRKIGTDARQAVFVTGCLEKYFDGYKL